MLLDKFTQFKFFEIWDPRWKDRKVLLDAKKIGEHNKIVFTGNPKTGTNSMGSDPYYVSGKEANRYPKEYNGKIFCRAVPLDVLSPLELSENSVLDLK